MHFFCTKTVGGAPGSNNFWDWNKIAKDLSAKKTIGPQLPIKNTIQTLPNIAQPFMQKDAVNETVKKLQNYIELPIELKYLAAQPEYTYIDTNNNDNEEGDSGHNYTASIMTARHNEAVSERRKQAISENNIWGRPIEYKDHTVGKMAQAADAIGRAKFKDDPIKYLLWGLYIKRVVSLAEEHACSWEDAVRIAEKNEYKGKKVAPSYIDALARSDEQNAPIVPPKEAIPEHYRTGEEGELSLRENFNCRSSDIKELRELAKQLAKPLTTDQYLSYAAELRSDKAIEEAAFLLTDQLVPYQKQLSTLSMIFLMSNER